jgi:hypothetical protein
VAPREYLFHIGVLVLAANILQKLRWQNVIGGAFQIRYQNKSFGRVPRINTFRKGKYDGERYGGVWNEKEMGLEGIKVIVSENLEKNTIFVVFNEKKRNIYLDTTVFSGKVSSNTKPA